MSRVINMYYNVNTNKLVDGTSGYSLRPGQYPWVFFKEQPIINLRLVSDNSLTAHTAFTGTTYAAAIDQDFDAVDGDLMCYTADSGINDTNQWLADPDTPATADPTAGQFSIQLDANTYGFQSKIGASDVSLTAEFELMSFDGSGNITGVLRMPILARNLVHGEISEVAASIANYVTEETIDGQKALVLRNSEGVVLATFEPQ